MLSHPAGITHRVNVTRFRHPSLRHHFRGHVGLHGWMEAGPSPPNRTQHAHAPQTLSPSSLHPFKPTLEHKPIPNPHQPPHQANPHQPKPHLAHHGALEGPRHVRPPLRQLNGQPKVGHLAHERAPVVGRGGVEQHLLVVVRRVNVCWSKMQSSSKMHQWLLIHLRCAP